MIRRKYKGSILAVTLFILSIILTTALAVSLAAIKQRNASLGSGKSTKAFQNADAGIEAVLNEIVRGNSTTVSGVCGVIDGAGYKVELYDKDNNKLSCSSAESKGVIASIKSIGEGADQQTRAIEAVAAATTLEWEGLSPAGDWDNYDSSDHNTLQYAKDNRTGLVYLRGWVKNSGNCSGNYCTVATITDEDYQPLKNNIFSQIGASGSYNTIKAYRVEVRSNGNVIVFFDIFPSSYLSLDGIVFSTN